MSDLGLTIAGVSHSLPNSYNEKKGAVVSITPTVATGAHTTGDILFISTALPKAVREKGGISKLVNITGTCLSSNTVESDMIFHTVSKSIGTIHNAPNISDTEYISMGYLGHTLVQDGDWSILSSTHVTGGIYVMQCLESHADRSLPLMIKAPEDSTTIYVTSIIRDTSNLTSTSDLTYNFHFEYMS